MKKKILNLILVVFLSSVLYSAYGATDNVIIRVGYPRLGENQYVGTVRIYESESTIDSIQKGDIFTIFVENAEFISPAKLVERGRYGLNIISGGKDGDSYITYEFVDASPVDTGRVIIDFEFDNMRVLGGDVTARVDSMQYGVTSSYFSNDGSDKSDEEEKDEESLLEEEIIINNEKLKEAVNNEVNILVQSDDYQILLPNNILKESKFQEIIEKKYNLKVNIKREKPLKTKYLTDIYSLIFTVTDANAMDIEKLNSFDNDFYLKIKDEDIKDKRNVKGVSIKDSQDDLYYTHYDEQNDQVIVIVEDFNKSLSIIRASNTRELVFAENEYTAYKGKNYIPIRKSATYYDWEVSWNPHTRTVNLEKDDKAIEINDYIILKERSYISTEFLRENLQLPIFVLDKEIVLKNY